MVASSSLFLRGMPRDVIRAAKAEAARRGQPLARVFSDAVRQALDGVDEPDPLADDLAWFEKHRPALARRYRGRYVAIVDREVIDADRDFDRLARRVFATLGPRHVLMPRALPAPEPEKRIRSPRVIRT